MTAPFGIALGSTPSESDVIHNVIFTNVPKGHPDFPVVVGEWMPKTGLCRINGYTQWSELGPHSLALRSEYEHIKEQLAASYGDYADVRECAFSEARLGLFDSASLPASTEIMSGVIWRADTGAEMPSDLDHITLLIQVLLDYEARVCLSYGAFRDDISLSDVL